MRDLSAEMKERVKKIMRQNRRTKERDGPDGEEEWQYTVPSPDSYPYQWLWDSCFHAIILSHFDIPAAKREIESLLSAQFENGMIPHMIYWEKQRGVIDVAWGKDGTSSITQPPMIAYAVWQVYEAEQDAAFLSDSYPELFHFYKYLLNDRDPHERHLVGIINPDESGEDNSPRFDSLLDLPPQHKLETNFQERLKLVEKNKTCDFDAPFCMKNFFWVKDVPMNVIMIENLRCLAKIARELGEEYDADYFDMKADQSVAAMYELMHDEAEDLFFSVHGPKYTKLQVKTWAIFAPLFIDMLDSSKAKRLVEDHLLNEEEFWTEFPLPSVALDEPSFDPDGFWRGPTWLASNWFIYKGLKRHGFDDVAQEIKDKSLALLEQSGFREQFDPHTGEGQGARDFTWGGLVLDMD